MASSGSHGEKPWQEEGRVSDPRGYDRARIDRWSCPARVPANEVRTRHRNRQAERREASAPVWNRCDTRLVSVVWRASQARSLNAPSRRSAHPFTGAGRRRMRSAAIT